jgi:hypothetical protein
MKTHHLKRCDILLFKRKGFLSGLIGLGTKSPYNGVAITIEPHIRLALGSNPGHRSGVRAIDLKSIDDNKVDVFRLRPEFGYDGDRMIAFLIAHLEVAFDYKGLLWLSVLKLGGLLTGFFWKPYRAIQKERDYFCSELCYEAFMAGGADIVPQVNEADITSPVDISKSDRLEKIAP